MLIKYPCPSNNITCHPFPLFLAKGKWKIELWGAGTSNGGGYTSGVLTLLNIKTLYAFLGGQEMPPGKSSGYGGYNGGGNSTVIGMYNSYYRGTGGSGSTDIRLIENDINSRIMVAGGSGGGSCNMVNIPGGHGGGLIAGNGDTHPNYPVTGYGKGGTQEEGGQGKKQGSLLYGANSTPTGSTDCAGAGGGGYYGGGSGYDAEGTTTGGGGSSYISGYNGCKKHSSNTVFSRTVMIPGNESMPQPDGTTKVGYIGQGALKITFLSSLNTCKSKRFFTTSIIFTTMMLSS